MCQKLDLRREGVATEFRFKGGGVTDEDLRQLLFSVECTGRKIDSTARMLLGIRNREHNQSARRYPVFTDREFPARDVRLVAKPAYTIVRDRERSCNRMLAVTTRGQEEDPRWYDGKLPPDLLVLQLAHLYRDQPLREEVIVASKPTWWNDGHWIFCLSCGAMGTKWLGARQTDHVLSGDELWATEFMAEKAT
jgi:hypothetical protein